MENKAKQVVDTFCLEDSTTGEYKEMILEREGLSDWKISVKEKESCGLVLHNSKTIIIGENASIAMFLHEVAHAKTKEGHTGRFADEFTRLVEKYLL